jgi:hypothetical protein
VKAQDFLRQALVAGSDEPCRTRSSVSQSEKVEQRRHARIERALSVKRLRQVEHEIGRSALEPRHDRCDVIVYSEGLDVMTETAKCGGQLIEHRIDRRLERVGVVQERDLHVVAALAALEPRDVRRNVCVYR